MSRSSLFERFAALVGGIGLSISYESEAAFSRAYKALFGHSPNRRWIRVRRPRDAAVAWEFVRYSEPLTVNMNGPLLPDEPTLMACWAGAVHTLNHVEISLNAFLDLLLTLIDLAGGVVPVAAAHCLELAAVDGRHVAR